MTKDLKFTIELARRAGGLLMKHFKKGVEITWKRLNDPVTEADRAVETFIIKKIRNAYPKDAIFAEESKKTPPSEKDGGAKRRWIVDPLDGTKNFAHGIPMFCVSICLEISGKVQIGVTYNPTLNELFYAEKGGKAYLNGKVIQTSGEKALETAVICTGFVPNRKSADFRKGLKSFNVLTGKTSAVRRLGSAALDMAYVACGRLDAFWEYGLHIWDVAAGAVIVEAAGGRVTDLNGNPLITEHQKTNILATNGKIHREMLKNIS